MAATKGAMTSLPASQTIFLQTVDEAEDNRINFRDSLKFFQEQLVINGASFPSPSPVSRSGNGSLRKNGHRFCKEQNSDNNTKISRDSDVFEDEIQSAKSCKIAIPTVDTILESVRVLRAIQKSQEERGSCWNLDVASKSSPDSDINYTDDWIPIKDINQNGYSGKESNNEGKEICVTNFVANNVTNVKDQLQVNDKKSDNTISSVEDLNCNANLNSVNEKCPFWPNNNLVFGDNSNKENVLCDPPFKAEKEDVNKESKPHNKDRENAEKQEEKTPLQNENLNDKSKNNEKFSEKIQENGVCSNISIQEVPSPELTNPFDDSNEDINKNTKIIDTPDSLRSDFLSQLNEKSSIVEENTKEIFLKESQAATEFLKIETYEDIDTEKHDHFLLNESLWKETCSPSDSSSTKIEHNDSDSGIGTQRSASSLSPNIPSQMQKDSWSDTCSSQYASAECSPYHSLNSVFESSLGLNNTGGETSEIENTEILSRLTENEWEDVLDKPKETIEKSTEDHNSQQQGDNDTKEGHNSDRYLTATPIHFSGRESPCVELDTEISYCHFITNYTIENPCKRTEQQLEETKPSSEICDNNEKEQKAANALEISTCEQTINTEDVVSEEISATENVSCEQVSVTENVTCEQVSVTEDVTCEQVSVTENVTYEKVSDTTNIVCGQILDAGEVGEQSLDTEKVICEQTTDIENVVHEQTVNSEEVTSDQILCTEKATSDETLDTISTNSLIIDHQKDVEDDVCDSGRIQKFTAASCDLISIVKSLYTVKENPAYQIIPIGDETEEKFEEPLFVLSEGAFCEHPEENYLVTIENSILNITKDFQVLLSLNMKYGEVATEKNILKIDNRMGRCVYIKSDFSDLARLKNKVELHCLKHWQTDCLQLVHYPLKCHQNVVIIDVGSCSTRAGILMDQPTLPNLFFPTICATDRRTGTSVYGMEALQPEVRQHSNLSFPVRPTNKITKHTIDIDLMDGLFKKIFHDLKVDPTQYTIQVCLPRNLSINAQTALVKLLLEDLKVKAVSLTNQALLTLYAHDVSTAVVVDIGDRTDVLPVVDGFIVENGVTKLPHGGQRLIHHMKHGLAEKRIGLSNDIDSFVVQYIIENLAYVAEDYDKETKISSQYPDIVKKTVTLQPALSENLSYKSVTLDEARFKIPEGLFNPDLWGLDSPGIHHLVQKAIQATSVDARKRIAENIFVSGGVTMLPGFVERLNKEVAKLSKAKIVPKVYASNYRYHCSYIGACKFAKMEVFPQVCINLNEYTKNSASALKKCALYF